MYLPELPEVPKAVALGRGESVNCWSENYCPENSACQRRDLSSVFIETAVFILRKGSIRDHGSRASGKF